MSNSIAPGSSADVNVKVTALTTNPNVPAQYKTIILKKNLVNGVNTLTQEMMSAQNIKYVVKYDYALGEDITVPANCVLEFDGGSITASGSNTTITGQNTNISNIKNGCLHNIKISGTFVRHRTSYSYWFDNNYDTAELLEALALLGEEVFLSKDRTYNIMSKEATININKLYSDGATLEFDHLKGISISNNIVEVCGINFTMNFDPSQYPDYDPTSGAGLGIYYSDDTARQRYRCLLFVHDCTFTGHWDSSCIVSSFTSECIVRHCKFYNIVSEDHIIYCSTSITNMLVEDCLFDFSSTSSTSGRGGRIKARTTTGTNVTVRNCQFNNVPDAVFQFVDIDEYFNLSFENNIVNISGIDAYAFMSLSNSKNAKINILNCSFENASNTSGTEKESCKLLGGTIGTTNILSLNIDNSIFKNVCFLDGPGAKYLKVSSTNITIEEGYSNKNRMITAENIDIQNCDLKLISNQSDLTFYSDDIKHLVTISSTNIKSGANAVVQNGGTDGLISLKFINSVIDCSNRLMIRNANALYIDFDKQTIIKDLNTSYQINVHHKWLNATFGSTSVRPDGTNLNNGHQYFDTDLKKLIMWNASISTPAWTNLDGSVLN